MTSLSPSPSPFQENSLYIGLYVRDTEPGTYHWSLYLHHVGSSGKKYHIRNIGSGWMSEFEIIKGALKEMLLIGYLRIANISPDSDAQRQTEADRLIESTRYDGEGVTCRTWLLDAVQKMRDAGIVRCRSIEALEEEAKAFGATHFSGAGLKTSSPAVVDSKVCMF